MKEGTERGAGENVFLNVPSAENRDSCFHSSLLLAFLVAKNYFGRVFAGIHKYRFGIGL